MLSIESCPSSCSCRCRHRRPRLGPRRRRARRLLPVPRPGRPRPVQLRLLQPQQRQGGDQVRRRHREGSYTYVDPEGKLQTVQYISDAFGFRVAGTNIPVHVVDQGGNSMGIFYFGQFFWAIFGIFLPDTVQRCK